MLIGIFSDVEDLPPYSLPPTPSISDDSDDLFVLSCLPKIKSVSLLEILLLKVETFKYHTNLYHATYVEF